MVLFLTLSRRSIAYPKLFTTTNTTGMSMKHEKSTYWLVCKSNSYEFSICFPCVCYWNLAGTSRDMSTATLFQSKWLFPPEKTNLTSLELHLHPGWPLHKGTEEGLEGRSSALTSQGNPNEEWLASHTHWASVLVPSSGELGSCHCWALSLRQTSYHRNRWAICHVI